MEYNLKKTHEGIEINGVLIDEKIFDEEKVDYRPVFREDQIDNLINWISEASGSNRESDLYLMKEDLKYLINLSDEMVFSSLSTNEFIARSDDLEEFNEICKEILEINKILGM